MFTIQNEFLSASIRACGAEMCSIRDNATGREFMWQGDPSVWNGQSPLLFPVIGRMVGGGYTLNGKKYAMPMHGFARKMDFALESQSADRVCLLLRDTEETREVYPFAFELRISLALENDAVVLTHTVTNKSESVMPFCLGAHPGFFCDAGDELHLEAPETLKLYQLDAQADLLNPQSRPYDVPDGRIRLSHTLFADDALMFSGIQSRAMTLVRQDGSSVRVEYANAPAVGVWSKPFDPLRYVCIEPWFGIDDATNATGEFTDKPHCQKLAPGESFVFPIRILPKVH